MEQTLVIVKPDGVERRLIGEIVRRFERKGFRLQKARFEMVSRSVAESHYAEHREKPFFEDLVAFITRSPAMVMVWEGPEGTIAAVRALVGATNPLQAAPGSIRGDFGVELTENLVHASDSPASAAREIALFFPAS